MAFPNPTAGVMEGHAFPTGTFLLLACDLAELGEKGTFSPEVICVLEYAFETA
jgi:enoyl-CoA hydratase/carnithine racemase